MPTFVHLASEKDSKRIAKQVLRGQHWWIRSADGHQELRRAVFCMPVMPNFHLTYQWLRELKRGGQRTMVGIHFRISDAEPVWYGRYNEPHLLIPAGEAAGQVLALPDAEGYEIVVPRSIQAKEIVKVRCLPQTVGWRFRPGSHQETPRCSCPVCIPPGSIKSRRLRERLERGSGA